MWRHLTASLLIERADGPPVRPALCATWVCFTIRCSDGDPLDRMFRVRAAQIHMQQAVLEYRRLHLHAVGQHEGAQESAGRYAPVQEGPVTVGGRRVTPSGDGQLAAFDTHFQLI